MGRRKSVRQSRAGAVDEYAAHRHSGRGAHPFASGAAMVEAIGEWRRGRQGGKLRAGVSGFEPTVQHSTIQIRDCQCVATMG